MYKKIVVSLLSVVAVLLAVNIYFELTESYEAEALKKDFEQNQEIFEKAVELFPYGEYKKITAVSNDRSNEYINCLFEDLQYTEIYSDYSGNVFFNRFEEGINFRGLVYVTDSGSVIGIIKTKSIVIDNEGKWIIHYSHGL